MRADLREHVNSLIEGGLRKCSDRQVDLFRRMYSPNDVDAPLSGIVRKIPDGKSENAWDQVKRTVVKNEALTANAASDAKKEEEVPICPGCSEANGTDGWAVVRHDPPLCKSSAEEAATDPKEPTP